MDSSTFTALIYLVSVVAIPMLAHKKGRNWLYWLIGALFLGPFMFIPLLIAKSRLTESIDVTVSYGSSNDLTRNPWGENQSATANLDPNVGFVYVISNPSLPDNLIKIGFTTRDPTERIKELDQAGLPTAYIEHYRIFTKDARQLEARLHQHFSTSRFSENKEFFQIRPYEVYAALKAWGVKPLEL